MTDFADSIRGWGSDDGDAAEEYERLLAAYKQAIQERDDARMDRDAYRRAAEIAVREHEILRHDLDEARGVAKELYPGALGNTSAYISPSLLEKHSWLIQEDDEAQ